MPNEFSLKINSFRIVKGQKHTKGCNKKVEFIAETRSVRG
jgi:hypothetical protein